jgi:hypothetical protein
MEIQKILIELYEALTLEQLNVDGVFYVGKGFKNVPDFIYEKKVVVLLIIDDFSVYYAPNIFT